MKYVSIDKMNVSRINKNKSDANKRVSNKRQKQRTGRNYFDIRINQDKVLDDQTWPTRKKRDQNCRYQDKESDSFIEPARERENE